MASLGTLTAGIAHEIKNPLNFIVNFSALSKDLAGELAEELVGVNEAIDEETRGIIEEIVGDLRSNAEKINHHGKRADSIVRNMLEHSRGQTGEFRDTDLNALLEEYVNLAYHGLRANDKSFNITIERDYDETLERLNVVPQDLSRVFLNLVNNACYAAHERSGKGEPGYMPTLTVSTRRTPEGAEIRVRDNGTGIPKEICDKVFQPFFTTKPTGSGTGLGLSISYDIVTQQHGGQMTVESEEGVFTEFRVLIPARARPAQSDEVDT
jgi:signal transduction histidine kinase